MVFVNKNVEVASADYDHGIAMKILAS